MTVNDIINVLIGKINLCKELNDWCAEISLSQLKDILDLINRQKAEIEKYKDIIKLSGDTVRQQKAKIERLKYQINRLKEYDEKRDIALHSRLIATSRAEAVNEFADLSIKRICESVTPIPQQKYLVDMCIQEIENTKKKWLEVVNEKN